MADSTAPSAGRVFISYRREETAYPAGWLFDRLADRFGRRQIFKDVDSIQLGDDFVEVITTAVASCHVLLALIGEQWLTITDEQGRRRLDDPNDFVRLELEAALTRNVRVIPILVAGARMPRPDQLPPSLAKLVRRQALELSPSHFESDTSRLHNVLDKALAEVHARPVSTEARVTTRQASARALYVEARAEMRLGHFQIAIDLLDDLLARDPSHQDGAQLRTAASRQLHLADTYQSAIDAEASSRWTDAANAYAEVLDADATYRDAAARREACQARQQVLDLQSELRHHAAAGQWQAVLDVNAELGHLDPAAADPDGLATQAQHALDDKRRADELAHRYTRARDAEGARDWAAAAGEYGEIVQLDPQYRDALARQDGCLRQQRISEVRSRLDRHIAAEEWAKVRETFDQLTALDPALALNYTEFADRARAPFADRARRAPGAPRVSRRRRVAIAAAIGGVVVAAGVTTILVLSRGHPAGRTVEIPATQAWTDTHVDCQNGKLLEVAATGTVLHNKSTSLSAVGPDGDSNPDLLQFNVPGLPNANHAALIGSIDRQQPFFVVGTRATLQCLRTGSLFLGINDIGVTNNSGEFTVTIKQR
jgi:tetratricopeptide (TPR) repeat protein